MMSCPYSSNAFCSDVVPDTLKETLCAHCSIKSYSKSQLLTMGYWTGPFTVLVDGLLVGGYQEPDSDKLFVTGMGSKGWIIGNSNHFKDIPTYMTGRIIYCVTKCTTAVFDGDFIHTFLKENHEFDTAIMRHSFRIYWYEKEALMYAIGSKDTYQAVKYVVKYCNDNKIPALTHEQIAIICNRARPTVTNTLHQLIRKEPELFKHWNLD